MGRQTHTVGGAVESALPAPSHDHDHDRAAPPEGTVHQLADRPTDRPTDQPAVTDQPAARPLEPAESVDVLIVGAGPAGCAAAVTLARAGRRVVVIDKATFPRDKCCGDGLTTGALRRLQALGLDPTDVDGWQWVDDVRIRSSRGRVVSYSLPRGAAGHYAAVAPRLSLDHALVGLARTAGVDLREATALTGAQLIEGGVAVTAESGSIAPVRMSAPWVIGADGMWSPLRKLLDPSAPAEGPAASQYLGEWHAYRQYFSGVTTAESRHLWVWFERDLLPGYMWSFPLPDGRANVGFGVERRPGLHTKVMKELWNDLLRRPHIAAVLGAAAVAEDGPKAWPIPCSFGSAPLTIGRALFVGDAARSGDVLTGEGIGQALQSGVAAAESILAARPYDAPTLRTDHRMAAALSRLMRSDLVCRGAIRLTDSSDWSRRNFVRWMFEDYPRGIALTPKAWHRGALSGAGTYRPNG